jgi:hypothetical protein
MSAEWRFIKANRDVMTGDWTIEFCVGVDQYASATVFGAAYPDGPWRDVIQAMANGMEDPASIVFAPRRRDR